ncbi:glycosyltransferase family 87 protein [Kitasatospora sp. NPDC001664]
MTQSDRIDTSGLPSRSDSPTDPPPPAAVRPWAPARLPVLLVLGTCLLGILQKLPCYRRDWFFGAADQYTHACYSDIPHLYSWRGLAAGLHPYLDRLPNPTPNMQFLEYPVLTGLFMQVAAWLTPASGETRAREQWFWLVNSGMLTLCAVVTVVALLRAHRGRRDALLFALAPALALDLTINWDLLAVALAAVAMAYWSAERPGAAGVFIGLATAAKFYPFLLLGPLLLLCWRAGKWRDFRQALAGAAAGWLFVNFPVMYASSEGWATFYTFSQARKEDFGSFWLILMQERNAQLESLNTWVAGLLIAACLGICRLALSARRRPRFAQLAFLIVAAFILTNKVYSPQYVLWLIPLAALARPRRRDFLIWQACEVLYFLGIWSYLARAIDSKVWGIDQDWYQAAICVHLLGTLYLCVMVVRDVLRPELDPVRRDGADDPSGGVLDRAPDVFVLGAARRRPSVPAAAGHQHDDGVVVPGLPVRVPEQVGADAVDRPLQVRRPPRKLGW